MKTISDFIKAECVLATKPPRATQLPIFIGIFDLTHGNPCTTGCEYYDAGRCPAYRRLHPTATPAVAKEVAGRKSQRRETGTGYARPNKKPFRW